MDIGQIVIVTIVACLAVTLTTLKLYRDLASLRSQLVTARAQIEAQMALRADLLKQLQGSMRSLPGGPAIVGKESHELLADLKTAEDKIEFARDYYNETAKTYEERLRVFPYSVIASSFNMRPCEVIDLNLERA